MRLLFFFPPTPFSLSLSHRFSPLVPRLVAFFFPFDHRILLLPSKLAACGRLNGGLFFSFFFFILPPSQFGSKSSTILLETLFLRLSSAAAPLEKQKRRLDPVVSSAFQLHSPEVQIKISSGSFSSDASGGQAATGDLSGGNCLSTNPPALSFPLFFQC